MKLKIRASEQPEEVNQQNDLNDNSEASIYNQEEYNKIFRPQKEILRRTFYFL